MPFTRKYIRLMSAKPLPSRPVRANVCVADVEEAGAAAASVGACGPDGRVQTLAGSQPVPVFTLSVTQ